MKLTDNLILKSDSYKVSHYKQYPPKTQKVFSYLEARGGAFEATKFFGLQYILKKYFTTPVTSAQLMQASYYMNKHFGNTRPRAFNWQGWDHILEKHKGYLPLKIRAVPEGTVVPTGNVLMTIENTDPECYWLTNYMESLLMHVWYPTTVATLSMEFKKIIKSYMEKTCDNLDGLPFKLHDFGYRGVSSDESAQIGGAAHLLNFSGTDTMPGFGAVIDYYSTIDKSYMPGFSIPASEHSTITSWGKEGELAAMENMLDQYPEGLVACVSDSFDIYKACREYWGTALREKILNRNGTLVIRPDSGDPVTVILNCLSILGDKFGYTKNAKGYKVLPPQIRLIQGDGVDLKEVERILDAMAGKKWSTENIAFGSGGALLQKMDRDTSKFAIKCSAALIDGKLVDVSKDPITDHGKKSKSGILDLVGGHNGEFKTVTVEKPGTSSAYRLSCTQTVFENGKLLVDDDFETIRQRG